MNFPTMTARSMKTLSLATLGLTLSLTLLPASAMEVAGVNFRPSIVIGKASLMLNGAGVRQQSSAGLYSAGLYLEKKAATPKEVLLDAGSKQLRLVMLRDITSKQLLELLSQGLTANNNDQDLSTLVSEIFGASMFIGDQGKLSRGDAIQIDSSPSGSTTITITNSKLRGGAPASQTFNNPGMFKAMMSIWLGERPADPKLKSALLGQPV